MPEARLTKPSEMPEEAQRRGQLVLRALPVLLIPVFTATVAYILISIIIRSPLPAASPGQYAPVVAIIVIGVFATALIVLVRIGRPTMSALLLIGVWTLLTTLATLRGGMAGLGPALLVIPICAAGLLIDGAASMSLAALASTLVVSVAWLQIHGLYLAPDQPLPPEASPIPLIAPPIFSAAVWTGLYWTVALLTSLLAGGLQRALQQSREQAEALRELSSDLEAHVAAQTAELARRAAKAEALYGVSQALTSTLDLNQILALITEQAAHLLGFDAAQALLQQPDGGFVLLGAYPWQAGGPAGNGDRGTGTGAAATGDEVVAALEPLLAEVSRRREARVVTLPAWPAGTEPGPAQSAAAGPPPSAALLLPMHYASRVSGVLMLTNAGGRADCDSDDLGLGQGLADQAAVAIANAQLLDEVRATATLAERTRLARDIHDTLAQGLTGVVVQLGATQRALAVAPAEAREHLGLALKMARESLAEARRSVWNLRTPALAGGSLATALKALTLRPTGAELAVTFEQRGEPYPLSASAESTLLRVCREALVNVTKHAQASEASVVLTYETGQVRLSISDNGIGFEGPGPGQAADAPDPWGGFGLLGMRERIAALGGTLQIGSDQGAHIIALVPRTAGDLSPEESAP